MRTLPLIAASLATLCLALFALNGCGKPDPGELTDAGHSALGSGDYRAAYDKFDAALKAFEPSDPRALEAELGRCRAQAHLEPEAAKARFLELSATTRLQEMDYNQIVSELKSAGERKAAIEVLAAGITKFPETTNLVALRDKIGAEAEAAGDTDALDDLKGLGYVGDD